MSCFRCTILILALALIGCVRDQKQTGEDKQSGVVGYARGFSIQLSDSITIVKVYDPWREAKGITYTYRLHSQPSRVNHSSYDFLIPVRRAICLSSTHIGYISALGMDSTIVGISGTQYVNNPNIIERIKQGRVVEVGYDQSLNYEIISKLKPDVVFVYGVQPESVTYIEKLMEMGIRVVMVPDYLESSPLGRAEWIKFFGVFFGKAGLADSVFNDIEVKYLQFSGIVQSAKLRPIVFLNIPFRDIWYFPGNDNYFVRFIHDAGGQYVFSELKGNTSHPVSTELAYKAGINSDIWLNPGAAQSLDELAQVDKRFTDFKPFRQGKVFNNNKRIGPGGGNDFWESGVVHPELILRDLIKIFHPELLPNDSLYYYQLLK